MKRKTKSLLFFTIVTIFLLLGTTKVNAATQGTYDGDLTYYKENGKVRITDCNEYAERITIPSKIEGCPVTEISS